VLFYLAINICGLFCLVLGADAGGGVNLWVLVDS